ncbi:Aminoacyl-tRNA synthetase, class 1a, anticodon-binding [Pseudocohnilembus persalinus]|uniref:methionine--tRNA ligase n=1 Tax=Pseudocohnilembus persalinus TaxID=266149 RepID=A0A0V0R3I8_PSEPJ|nr:Aminoacyl-tRNA synthetase, class 1a, anticodon-binding [Pseudocohnilembus persalinus]|eukprot:KRX09065.1 Aminoacyl-tRNA synthetase, class 1a, anticodon-binding [Pseudocohnilembus persalinus]
MLLQFSNKKKIYKKAEKAEKKQKAEAKAQKSKNVPQGKEKVFKKKQEDIDPEYLKKFQSQKIKRLPLPENPTPIKGQDNILITSALPYCNNAPHLGTLIGCVLSADVYSRYCRLRGYNSIYVCGTDEYGTATEMRAKQEGLTPDEICSKYWKIHDSVYRWFDIDFDKFGRTHTEKHTKITQDIFKDLKKNEYITENSIEQYFCDSCQTFLADRYVKGTCPHCQYADAKGDQCDGCGKLIDQLIDPKCSICSSTPKLKDTDHFYINLPKLQDKLEKWIDKASVEGNWSANSVSVSKAWIKQGLQERCITRDLKWGTPVPVEGWEKKVFYVWFDAPIGYISITANLTENWEKWWKQSDEYNVKLKQFMAKDNIPFHCVIFPCTMLGQTETWTKLEQISSCEYLNYEDKKFSKSNGTGVFGDDAEKTGIPSEVWRYYLLINRPEKSDTIFTWNEFAARNNNELLANPGNLANRGLKFCYKSFEKKVPEPLELQENDTKTINAIWGLFQEYLQALDKIEIKKGLERVMNISSQGNLYMQENEPWVKANQESGRSRTILFVYCNILRFLSLVFEPYLPSLSAKINFLLGFEERTERDEFLIKELAQAQDPVKAILSLVKPNQQINQPVGLFKELTQEEIEGFKAKFGGQQAPVQKQK